MTCPRLIALSLLISITSANLLAQAPDSLWSKSFGTEFEVMFNSIDQLPNGGYIVGGFREFSSDPDREVRLATRAYWLVRLNSAGDDTVWTKTFHAGGTEGRMAIATSDGGAVIVGSGDPRLIKTDGNGDVLWQLTATDLDGGIYGIEETADGGFIACGANSTGQIATASIARITAAGVVTWQKSYGPAYNSYLFSITELSTGEFAAAGVHRTLPESNSGDAWLFMISATGDSITSDIYGVSGVNNDDYFSDVRTTADGGFILLGNQELDGQSRTPFLIKTDGAGVEQWSTTLNSTMTGELLDVIQTSDGGFMLTGYGDLTLGSSFNMVLIHTNNADGTTDWSKEVTTPNGAAGTGLTEISVGEYLATGVVIPATDAPMDGWVLRLGATGPADPTPFELDSLALVALYDSTDSANWTNKTNWLTGTVDTWYGVTVNGGRVTQLDLDNNNLSGPLPIEIGSLTALTRLYLFQNQLTGAIPVEIGNLASLEYIYFQYNQLSGSIPVEIGSLTSLTQLYLHGNQLTGTIPVELGSLSSLQILHLYNNQLSGLIPVELGSLPSLTQLYLYSNQLTGAIPVEIGSLSSLTDLRIGGNQLSGAIPTELGSLTNLQFLYLYDNQLTGAVPTQIANLNSLTRLYLYDNQLTDLPDLTALTSLSLLGVENNHLTFKDIEPNFDVASTSFTYSPQDSVGAIEDTVVIAGSSLTLQVTVGGTSNQYLWMKDGVDIAGATTDSLTIPAVAFTDAGSYSCSITNTVATDLTLHSRPVHVSVIAEPFEADSLALVALYEATGGGTSWSGSSWNTTQPLSSWEGVSVTNGRVTTLHLYQHNLTGTIPASFADLTALTSLRLGNNQLGVFPEVICQLTSLESLYLNHMAITTVPDAIDSLVNLTELVLDYNELTTLPSTIGSLTNLVDFYANNNQLTSLPTEIGGLTSLVRLGFGNNMLTTIPDEIISLTNLTLLDLYLNQLSGELTAGIGGLTNLTHLGLYGNQLTSVPEVIGNLTSLQYLDLGDNLLATIPGGIGNLASLTDLRLNGNELTAIPDTLGRLGSLQHLSLYGNQISTTPALMNQLGNLVSLELSDNLLTEVPNWVTDLPNLQYLMLYDNEISYLDDWISNLPAVVRFFIYGNNIQNLPDLSALNNTLTDFRIMDNQLMFDDIIHVMEELPGATIIYNWQDSIGTVMDIDVIEGRTLELAVDIALGNNNYQWGKWGTIPAGITTTDSILVIPATTPNDAGDYYCAITNDDVPDLTLYTHLMQVTITEDMLPADSLIVVTLYDSLDGENWVLPEWFTPWDPSTPISSWGGIVVTDNRITQLNLYNLGLSGTIPPVVGNLSALTYLDFGWGAFTGDLPEEIGNLRNLFLLGLDSGGWQELPDTIGTLTGLISLGLQQNELSGPVPQWLMNLTNLNTWQLAWNNLTGPFPTGMDTLPNLAFLDIKHNYFTFEDIVPLMPIEWTVWYAPQGRFGIERDQAVLVGEPLVLTLDVAGSGNQYQWMKDGVAIEGATDSVYTKVVAEYGDTGVYTLEVTNAAAPELTLNSSPINLSVVDNPILPFNLVSPANNWAAIIANSNVGTDSLIFEWESTTDLGGDTVLYGALIDDGLNTVLTISSTTTTRIPIAYTDIAEALRVASVLSVGGYWQIYATAGSDTTWAANGPYQLTIDASTLDVLVQALLPMEYALHDNYPNPFNPTTTIRFDLPEQSRVSLILYDIMGREVVRLVDELKPVGYYELRWNGRAANGRNMPTGMYFARLVAPDYTKVIKMLLLK